MDAIEIAARKIYNERDRKFPDNSYDQWEWLTDLAKERYLRLAVSKI